MKDYLIFILSGACLSPPNAIRFKGNANERNANLLTDCRT